MSAQPYVAGTYRQDEPVEKSQFLVLSSDRQFNMSAIFHFNFTYSETGIDVFQQC